MPCPPNQGQDRGIPIWGLSERLPVLKVRPDVLLKARTVLRAGGAVLLLVDTEQGEYSPNTFRLAAALRAKVVFFTAELEDGELWRFGSFQPPVRRAATQPKLSPICRLWSVRLCESQDAIVAGHLTLFPQVG